MLLATIICSDPSPSSLKDAPVVLLYVNKPELVQDLLAGLIGFAKESVTWADNLGKDTNLPRSSGIHYFDGDPGFYYYDEFWRTGFIAIVTTTDITVGLCLGGRMLTDDFYYKDTREQDAWMSAREYQHPTYIAEEAWGSLKKWLSIIYKERFKLEGD